MIIEKHRWIICLSLMFLVPIVGCGRNDLEPLSGTVNFADEPLKCGTIIFVTEASSGIEAAAPPTSVGIKDGKFTVPQKFGLKQGAYRVTIKGYEGVPRGDLPVGLNIFPDFNAKFEYTGEGQTATFDVPKAKKPVKLDDSTIDLASPRADKT